MAETGLKKILIFDDDADFRRLLLARLSGEFGDVELEEYDPAGQGLPGKEFDWSRYDVLLLDYNLNIYGITGLDILQANRRTPGFPATIMLTGAGNEEVAVRALKAGVHDYMRKEKLDKEQLRSAIIEAYKEQQAKQETIGDFTRQSHAFNKALFYQQLEQQQGQQDGRARVLLLISLDSHKVIEELAGLIIRDNIIRHIAKQSYEIFQEGNHSPSITRFSDTTVALLIDDPDSRKTLEFNLEGLCEHLKKRPYNYEGRVFHFTVSIGAVRLQDQSGTIEAILRAARHSCVQAERQEDGNSFDIFSGSAESVPQTTTAEPEAGPPPRQQPADGDGSTAADEPAQAGAAEPAAPAGTQQPASGTSDPAPADEHERPPRGEKTGAPAGTGRQPASAPAASGDSRSGGSAAAPEDAGQEQGGADEEQPASGLDAGDIEQAFKQNRVSQTFQPVISLAEDDEEESKSTVYYVSLQMLGQDGTIIHADDIFRAVATNLRQSIDRWMLRETIGRIVNSSVDYLFIIRISKASVADATLFNWLRKLLSGVEQKQPGRSIALEIDATDFAAVQKPAAALITYLKKHHGFKFGLGNVSGDSDLPALCPQDRFDLVRLDHGLLEELSGSAAGQEDKGGTVITTLKDRGLRCIADNVGDAMTLTAAIGAGADYAMGTFIGEPAEQLEDQDTIESFEII